MANGREINCSRLIDRTPNKLNKKNCSKVFLYFWFNRSEDKRKEKVDHKQIYEKEDPGAVAFTSGFSREK